MPAGNCERTGERETQLQIPRKGNKYRKPINDKLLIGSRDGAGPLDVTMSDIHRFESRHKPSIIIERIVNEAREPFGTRET